MLHPFTAAAERALAYASSWTNRTGCDELEAETLLVGLLAQPDGDLIQIVLQQAEAAFTVVANVQGIIAGVNLAQVRRKPRHLGRYRPLVAHQQKNKPGAD